MEYRGDQNILGEGTNNKSYMVYGYKRGRQNESKVNTKEEKCIQFSLYLKSLKTLDLYFSRSVFVFCRLYLLPYLFIS